MVYSIKRYLEQEQFIQEVDLYQSLFLSNKIGHKY